MLPRPLRILGVANVAEDPNAGAAGTEYQTYRALRELGHEVDAVWRDEVGRRISHGNLNLLLELPRRYEAVVARKLAAKEYDVVHVNQPHGWRAARYVRRHHPRTAFIHKSHGWEPHARETLDGWRRIYAADERSVLRRAATGAIESLLARHARQIIRWADGHILCSTADLEFMAARNGADRATLRMIMQAAPDAYVTAPAAPMTPERLRTVLHVGQFAFFKAPMIAASAMNEIAAARDDVRFVWVTGTESHDALRALLSPSVRERLTLLPWMDQAALRAVYDTSGVFLFPSFFEGFGKVHFEAMSRGCCVVSRRVAAMQETIADGVNGRLIEAADASPFAAAALAFIGDPDGAAAVSRAAAATAQEYTWRRVAEETAEFYRERLAAKGIA